MDIKELEKIIKILKENGVTEFELEQDKTHIKLSRAHLVTAVAPSAVAAPEGVVAAAIPAQLQESSTPASDVGGGDPYAGQHKVDSPIVGTFYRKPSPDAEPFAREGDVVKKGDTLCIVEAMKLMNEIEAPVSGKVVRILPEDSQVVEFGELLVVIDPNG
ncbi:acetyl-CoA carboxylase biotin carboxyl carrier protein [bacterium]|nr:acetyl-CoA carboxylase biotin carboxyl carrier protein [bacterium]